MTHDLQKIQFNETAFEIFKLLLRKYSEDDIIKYYISRFEVSKSQIQMDIKETIAKINAEASINFLLKKD